ncbi:MAG: hypothetical protein IK099_06690 [Clostridia bacterium]|nr:hypothetical protein [Clostridia bacterium]
MKKLTAVLMALTLICLAAAASAMTVIKPNASDTLKALLGGKTYNARISGWGSIGEDEDAKFTVMITVSEEDRFDAAVIENLQVHDAIIFGNGMSAVISEITPDEAGTGFLVKGSNYDAYSFYKLEDGSYAAKMENDYPFWTDVFTVEVPLEKDVKFLDWSNPENLDAPVELGFDELLDRLIDGTDFAAYNTQVTFDENGKLVELLYSYSPWN